MRGRTTADATQPSLRDGRRAGGLLPVRTVSEQVRAAAALMRVGNREE
jgi:hypothetical protein